MEHVLVDRASVRLRRPARLLRLASDERLVELVRAGEESAFEVLYDRHYPAILGFCRHMLGTREEAEDAVQHTFLAAFRDLARSDKPIELRPWLFAIARNRCVSLLRARRAHVAIELAEPATDGLAATVERREDVRELLSDLASLPEDQRAALLLAELGTLDHAGIATVLGCPREKVKALVFQARTSLAASREARATPCDEIRLELATASGAALRRGPLRRHLRACDGCRAFKAEVALQRKLLAVALPVVPTIALKASVLSGGGAGAASSGGAAAAAATTAGTASGASGALGSVLGTVASTGAGKLAVSLAVVGMVAGGTLSERLAQHSTAAPVVYEPRGSALSLPSAPSGTLSAPQRASRPVAAPAPQPDGRSTPLEQPGPRGAGLDAASQPAAAPHDGLHPQRGQTPAHTEPSPRGTEPGATPGDGEVPPGQQNAPATPPGQTKAPTAPPNQENPPATPPGQSRAPATPPGQGKAPATPPDPSAAPNTAPGQAGTAPRHSGSVPSRQSGVAPGSDSRPSAPPAAPDQSGDAPGQSGASHGHDQ